jgi:4-amino-4-deoxy-L-arabinose transferase-like glycosyltransferase
LALLTFQEHFLRAHTLSDWLQPALTWKDHNAYPPLFYLVTGIAGAWCGGLEIAGLARTNIGWLALIVVSTYFLGRKLFGGRTGRLVGASAAAVVAFTPITLTQLPSFLLDLPATATFLMALPILAGNASMKSRSGALLVGVAVAAVALTKWLTILSLTPALLYVVFRVLREAPREERTPLAAGLVVLVLVLATAALLINQNPPRSGPYSNTPAIAEVLSWRSGLSITCIVVLFLTFLSVRSVPGRNLLLASSLVLLLSAPFYLTNLEMLCRHLTNEMGQFSALADNAREHGVFFSDPTLKAPMALLLLPGLVWLGLRGPRGGLAFVGLPMLANVGINLALSLPDHRHYLPGYPLEVLVTIGWLLNLAKVRTILLPLLAGLVFWNAGTWLTGQAPMYLSPAPLDGTPGFRGCGPESLNGQIASMMERVVELSGPGSTSMIALVEPRPLSALTLQTLSASRGYFPIIRGLEKKPKWLILPPQSWAIQYATLLDPFRTWREIQDLADTPFASLPRSWLIVLPPRCPNRCQPSFWGRWEIPSNSRLRSGSKLVSSP